MNRSSRATSWILYLACLLIFSCTLQRSINVSPADIPSSLSAQQHSTQADSSEQSPDLCDLSSKSLHMDPLTLLSLGVICALLSLLLAQLIPQVIGRLYQGPPRTLSLPSSRLHLRLCTFRE